MLFRNDQTYAVHRGSQIAHIGHQLDGAVGRNHTTPIQEVAFQQTTYQGGIADLEQNVLGAQG